jgi:hypothetical protein
MTRPPTLAFLALLLALSPAWASAQARTWAVVVGIDDYTYLDGVEGGDLLGAENDARAFVDYLTGGLTIPPEQIRLLTGGDATSKNIRTALSGWLRHRTQPGDRVYFFYSGHGSQALDENGDEEDGLDETISPVDALPYSPSNDLVDDEIDQMLTALAASEIIVILDSCSSGTATKVAGHEGRPRRLERPIRRPKGLATDSRGSGFVDRERGRIVELAASAPHQTALDAVFFDDEGNVDFYGGAFTTHLLRELWTSLDSTSLRDVLEDTRAVMAGERFQQNPQFSGSLTAPVKIRR